MAKSITGPGSFQVWAVLFNNHVAGHLGPQFAHLSNGLGGIRGPRFRRHSYLLFVGVPIGITSRRVM